ARGAPPAAPARHRRLVPRPRLLRSPRPGAGQVRDAAARPRRWPLGPPGGAPVRVLPVGVLPGPRRVPMPWAAGPGTPTPRPAAGPQALRRGGRLPRPVPTRRPDAVGLGAGRTGPAPPWPDGPSPQHRAGPPAAPKGAARLAGAVSLAGLEDV